MAQTYQLADNISITNNDGKIIVKKDNHAEFIVSDKDIKRIEENGETSLTLAEKRAFCHNILRAEFAIPDTHNITSIKLKQNKKGKFHLLITASAGGSSSQTDLKFNTDTVTVTQTAENVQKTEHNQNISKRVINAESNKTNREYTEQKISARKYSFQTFEDKQSLSLKRVIKDTGRALALTKETDKLEEDGFISRHKEKAEIIVSAVKITKILQIKDDAYKHKMQINFDTPTQNFDCIINDTKFEDITVVEDKNNALTAKTGIKTKVTKYIDRDFNAHLHLNADGTFFYSQEQTGSDGKLITFETDSDRSKIAAEIIKEIEKIKAVITKLNILKNNPKTNGQLDFTQNPNIFDEEIGFAQIQKENPARLAEILARGHAEDNRLLLAAVIQNNDGNALSLALQKEKQHS